MIDFSHASTLHHIRWRLKELLRCHLFLIFLRTYIDTHTHTCVCTHMYVCICVCRARRWYMGQQRATIAKTTTTKGGRQGQQWNNTSPSFFPCLHCLLLHGCYIARHIFLRHCHLNGSNEESVAERPNKDY